MGFERAQTKRSVRQAMKMTRPHPILTTLLFTMVVSVVTGMINGILGTVLTGGTGDFSMMLLNYVERGYEFEDAMERAVMDMLSGGPGFIFGMVVGGMVLSAIVSLWQAVMNVGYSGYTLSMVRGENPKIEKIFCAFPKIGAVLVTRILAGLFIFLWTLLVSVIYLVAVFVVTFVALSIDSVALMVLFMLAATVLYMIGVIWVTMRYALVDYVLLDKGLSGMDAIRESKRLMQGRIKDAFVLQLSFFGWYLLLTMIVYIGIFVAIMIIGIQVVTGSSDGGLIGAILLALAVMGVAIIGAVALSLWLRPYVSGCMAKFYDWANGRAVNFAMGPGGYGPGGYGPGGYGPGGGYGQGGGWGSPGAPGGPASGGPGGYNWTPGAGPSSGTGSGTGAGNGGALPPKPPTPKDDPWN